MMTKLEELKAAYWAACEALDNAYDDAFDADWDAARGAYYDELEKQQENSND
jgi:hypothetical protein